MYYSKSSAYLGICVWMHPELELVMPIKRIRSNRKQRIRPRQWKRTHGGVAATELHDTEPDIKRKTLPLGEEIPLYGV